LIVNRDVCPKLLMYTCVFMCSWYISVCKPSYTDISRIDTSSEHCVTGSI